MPKQKPGLTTPIKGVDSPEAIKGYTLLREYISSKVNFTLDDLKQIVSQACFPREIKEDNAVKKVQTWFQNVGLVERGEQKGMWKLRADILTTILTKIEVSLSASASLMITHQDPLPIGIPLPGLNPDLNNHLYQDSANHGLIDVLGLCDQHMQSLQHVAKLRDELDRALLDLQLIEDSMRVHPEADNLLRSLILICESPE